MGEETTDLVKRVEELEERVAVLERAATPRGGAAARAVTELPPVADRETFWALEVLRQRGGPPFEDEDTGGSVLFAGVARAPGTGHVVWQEERPVPAVLRAGWDDAAGVLAALGHPIRLEIVRRLLAGASTTGELAGIPALGTSGQLYHHLRELQGAGLVVQRRRNHYAVPSERVIPCLTMVAAALSREPLTPHEPDPDA
jgi:Helix-turn-helix domain